MADKWLTPLEPAVRCTALLNRPKDWVDIASMADAGSVDLEAVADVLTSLVGDDPRADRLRALG